MSDAFSDDDFDGDGDADVENENIEAEEDIDELVAANTPQSGKDDDDEYENPDQDSDDDDDGDDEDDGAIGDDDGEKMPDKEPVSNSIKQEEEEEEEEEDEEIEEDESKRAYLLHNRGSYYVPPSPDGVRAGRVRDHNIPIEVEDATTLGHMGQAKFWPKADQLPPLAIVVVKGTFDEDTKLVPGKTTGPFLWYARLVIKGKPNGSDRKFLRLIPKAVCQDFVRTMAKLDGMKKSSLITLYQPDFENAKGFPVLANRFKKVSGIKTEAIPKQRAEKLKQKPKEPEHVKQAEEASSSSVKPAMSSLSKKSAKPAPAMVSASSTSGNKRSAPSQAPAPGAKKAKPTTDKPDMPTKPEKKKPTTPVAPAAPAAASKGLSMPQPSAKNNSILNFTNKAKPSASAPAPAPAPASAPVGESVVESEIASAIAPTKRAGPAPVARSSDEMIVGPQELNGVFKKVDRIDCDSRDKTTVFWVGNSVFIGQF